MMNNKPFVYLHSDSEDQVWSISPGQPVIRDTSDLDNKKIRIPAFTCNTKLILLMYQALLNGQITSLQVCTPRCVPGYKSDLSEDETATLLWHVSVWSGRPASLGGWHDFNEKDNVTYRLALAEADDLIELFDIHPLSKVLKFVYGLNPLTCAKVLGLIRDPRWFEDITGDKGRSNLEAFFGLQKKKRASSAEEQRYMLLHSAWANCKNCFLSKITDTKNDYQVSKIFLKYLQSVWLQWLYQGRRELFVPEYFFIDDKDISDFKRRFKDLICQKRSVPGSKKET